MSRGIRIIRNCFHITKVKLSRQWQCPTHTPETAEDHHGRWASRCFCLHLCVWAHLGPEPWKVTLVTARQAGSNREQPFIHFQKLIFCCFLGKRISRPVFCVHLRVSLWVSSAGAPPVVGDGAMYIFLAAFPFLCHFPTPLIMTLALPKNICFRSLSQGLIQGESKLSHRLSNNCLLSHIQHKFLF